MRPFLWMLILLSPLTSQEPESQPTPPPDPAIVLNEEGVALYKKGEFMAAIKKFEQARRLRPKDEVIAINLGNALYGRATEHGKGERFEQALHDLDRAIFLNRKEPIIRVYKGRLLMRMGENGKAREVLTKALGRFPSSGACFEAMARLEYSEEHLSDALQLLETAAKLDPQRAKSFAGFLERVRREASVEEKFLVERRGTFTVKYDDAKFRAVSQEILDILDGLYNSLAQDMRHWPRRPLSVVLYTRGDYNKATGAHEWTGGLFDGKIRLPVRNFRTARSAIKATLSHELSHFFVRSMTKDCPLWLDEGLAQVRQGRKVSLANKMLERHKKAGTLVSIEKLPATWSGVKERKTVALYYATALSFTAYLKRQFGFSVLIELIEKLDKKLSFAQTFQAVYSRSLKDVETSWRGTF